MAVKAKASLTVTDLTDVLRVTPYWRAQSSTAATPAKPTTTSTSAAVSDWSKTMPAYDSSKRCYTCTRSERGDGSCYWSDVTEDQGWSGANAANSTATNASQTAKAASTNASNAVSTANTAVTNAARAQSSADAAQGTADDAWSRTLRVQVSSAPADAAGDTSTLTATVWRGGELLSDEAVAKMGLLAWYVGGSRVATGSTYTCAAGTAAECRLEA